MCLYAHGLVLPTSYVASYVACFSDDVLLLHAEELEEGLLAHKEEQWLLLESGRCTSA